MSSNNQTFPVDFIALNDIDDFSKAISNKFEQFPINKLRQNTKYFFNLLHNKLGAKTMLFEEHYFSQSFFDDYKFYHVNSYLNISKTCRRIHFFADNPPTIVSVYDIFLNASSCKEVEQFWASYLGYMVIRPLPQSIIGATLLRHPYKDDEHYKICLRVLTQEDINIFGRQLKNFSSLIFQEQDRIVGACATAALWSALDKAHEIFNTPLYSPSKLTELAEKFYDSKIPQRLFPNKNGLNLQQIAKILSKIGLDQEILINFGSKSTNNHILAKQFIYSHVKCGFPMIMGVEFDDEELHALTLIGFIEPKDKVLLNSIITKAEQNRLNPIIKSSYIEKFIVHDDQLGPFSEVSFGDKVEAIKIKWDLPKEQQVKLNSLLAIILPTWTFSLKLITNQVQILNNIFYDLNFNDLLFYWDFFICSSNIWKNNLTGKRIVKNQDIIFHSLPQYIWVLELFSIKSDQQRHFSNLELTILFDITSTNSFSHTIIDIIIHEEKFREFQKVNFDKTTQMINDAIEILSAKVENSDVVIETLELEKINIATKTLYYLRKLFHDIEKGPFS